MTAPAAAPPGTTSPHRASPAAFAGQIRPALWPRGRIRDTGLRAAVLAAAAGGWQLAAATANNAFLPPPTVIAGWMRQHWLTGPAHHLYLGGAVLHDAGASLTRTVTGWSLAAIAGITGGLLLGRSRLAHDLASPIVQFARSVPPVALIPVAFVLLPPGAPMQITLIATATVWPVLLNTTAAARSLPPGLLDTVRVLRVRRGQLLTHVLLPAVAPAALGGMRISFALALAVMVVSELYAATDGIGHALLAAQQSFDAPALWAWIVLLAVLANTGTAALNTAARRVLACHGQPDVHSKER